MARELGQPNVDQMLAQMTGAQFMEWMGFFIVEREYRDASKASMSGETRFIPSGDAETNLRAVFGKPKQ